MNEENTYNSITEALRNIPGNYKIMEETIDLEVQKEYYELIKTFTPPKDDNINVLISKLEDCSTDIDEIKSTLVRLAMLDSVEAFRAIERYNETDNRNIKGWSTLALQQSRMILQSSLLDEQQVYISTGLGGKENKLRYYLIFPYNNKISEVQQKSFESELNFHSSQYDGEIESIEISKRYASVLILLPLTSDIPQIIKEILAECNQLGNFLSPDVLITNMKKFSHEEIIDIINKYEKQ